MEKTQRQAEFLANLRLEQDAISTFIKILQKEEKALVQGKIEDLDQFTTQKIRIVNQLTNYGDKRDQFLSDNNLSLDTINTNNLFSSKDKNVEVSAVWTELLRLAKTAKQLNQTNEAMISTRLQQSQRALATLQSAVGTVSLYGPKGQRMAIQS